MNNFNCFLKSFLFLVLITTFFACGEEDVPPTPEPMNIAETIAGDDQFSILYEALQRVNLDEVLTGSGPFTLFAPTNTAFFNLGADLDIISDEDLTDILLYHVLSTKLNEADIADGQTYVPTSCTAAPNDNAVSLLIENDGGLLLNSKANVTTADIETENGVIHIIDEVLTPQRIIGHASGNPNLFEMLNTLLAADGDLATVLQGEGPFTVFAPVNTAFEAISDLIASLTPSELEDIMSYHLTAGNVYSTQFSDGMMVTTFNGELFTINVNNDEISLTDANGNNADVLVTNVQAVNGMIHLIETVILP